VAQHAGTSPSVRLKWNWSPASTATTSPCAATSAFPSSLAMIAPVSRIGRGSLIMAHAGGPDTA